VTFATIRTAALRRCQILQMHPGFIRLRPPLAGVQHFDADNLSVWRDVDGDSIVQLDRFARYPALNQSDIESIHL